MSCVHPAGSRAPAQWGLPAAPRNTPSHRQPCSCRHPPNASRPPPTHLAEALLGLQGGGGAQRGGRLQPVLDEGRLARGPHLVVLRAAGRQGRRHNSGRSGQQSRRAPARAASATAQLPGAAPITQPRRVHVHSTYARPHSLLVAGSAEEGEWCGGTVACVARQAGGGRAGQHKTPARHSPRTRPNSARAARSSPTPHSLRQRQRQRRRVGGLPASRQQGRRCLLHGNPPTEPPLCRRCRVCCMFAAAACLPRLLFARR